ncbi:hypothetical protein PQ478_08875 [Alkalihalophilus pseudofirmus]|uniref:hypothetical protein n=1 Tax=Alkalihalophilus pseudofirmus TaxID=79885 RepID=UPI00259B17EF|nr:hypothetical protein [Alkalihalophilus pseudofirmus]WEG18583.1 hypothetical protein PQ478_08875 [Alkalihalophilus pseudofirmus]
MLKSNIVVVTGILNKELKGYLAEKGYDLLKLKNNYKSNYREIVCGEVKKSIKNSSKLAILSNNELAIQEINNLITLSYISYDNNEFFGKYPHLRVAPSLKIDDIEAYEHKGDRFFSTQKISKYGIEIEWMNSKIEDSINYTYDVQQAIKED